MHEQMNVAKINLLVDFSPFNFDSLFAASSVFLLNPLFISHRFQFVRVEVFRSLEYCWHLSVVFIDILSFLTRQTLESISGICASDLFCCVTALH